jgi:hypothetical protein
MKPIDVLTHALNVGEQSLAIYPKYVEYSKSLCFYLAWHCDFKEAFFNV